MLKISCLAATLVLSLAHPVCADHVSEVGALTFGVHVGTSVLQIPYNANAPLSASSTQIQRAVVLLPGTNRNSRFGLDTLTQAAALAGVGDSTTLLVAPQFLIEDDISYHHLPADQLFWGQEGWKEGNQSLSTTAHPRPATVSSFTVMESIVYCIASHNPNLRTIVIAGHSAGGQFVNRFAAGNTIELPQRRIRPGGRHVVAGEQGLQSQLQASIEYVVANPSSYLYFDSERNVAGTFAVPADVVQSCPGYDDYKFGLQSLNTYMSSLSSTQIATQFASRTVSLLLGELDVDPHAPDLDTTCPAELQGSNRLERGIIYSNYILHHFGVEVAARHRPFRVPGVGHDSRGMFTSACGVALLFHHGEGGCTPVDAGDTASASGSPPPLVLRQSRPNPFRDETTIAFGVADTGQRSTLRVYDVGGRLVRTLYEGSGSKGTTMAIWDGRSDRGERVPAGVYFYRLQQGPRERTRVATLLR